MSKMYTLFLSTKDVFGHVELSSEGRVLVHSEVTLFQEERIQTLEESVEVEF